jgi:tetratricopeptide (TPR) repeat protein
MSRGDVLAMAGRIADAEAVYAETIKFDPNRLQPILNARAWFLDRPRGDYGAAITTLDETAKGGMIIQFLHRGLIYARLGKPDLALADFEEVTKQMKNRHEWFAVADNLVRRLAFLIGRAEAYLLKGELDRALAEIDEAIRFVPTSHEARILRAEIRTRQGKTDLAEADRLEASRLAPDPIITRP